MFNTLQRRVILLFFVTLFLFAPKNLFAATWYVGTVNADDNVATHGTDAGAPFATLGYAETQAADGDTVNIADGTYTVADYLDSSKAITWDGASKDGVIIKFGNAVRGIYLRAPSAVRTFQDMTLQNNETASGPSYLVEVNGASVNTVFDNVKFENGKRGAVTIPANKTGLTIQNSEIVGNISTYWEAIAAAGGYTVSSTTVTMTSDISSPRGVFYQSGVSSGEKVIITSSTIDVQDNFYVFRMAFGGLTAPEITNNTVTVSSTFSRSVVDLKRQTGEIITGNDFTIPSTVASAYGIVLRSPDGDASVATVNTNTIRIHNPSGYGILIGDEGGAESVDGAYDGSFIEGNTIYGSAVYGEGVGTGHALMAGFNQDFTIRSNTVEGYGYCIVAKYNGEAWSSGGIFNNTCTNNTYAIRLKGAANVSVTGNTITSNNGANTTVFAFTQNGAGEISATSTVTQNIISIDAGEAYNFLDDSDNGLSSDQNYFDIFDAAAMGNVNGGAQQSTLTNWQTATGQDANSYTWDLSSPPTIQFTDATPTGAESSTAVTQTIEASGVHPYTMTFDYAVSDGTASGAGTDYTFVDGSGSITAGNTTTTISMTVVDDSLDEESETVIIALSNFSNSSAGAAPTSTYTITDNDTAGITITESGGAVALTEGSGSDTYTVVLTSQPTNDVTVSIANGTGEVSFSTESIVFTSANWNTAVTVTVTAVNDTDFESAHTALIVHSASSNDANYNGIVISNITATITDNDTNAGSGYTAPPPQVTSTVQPVAPAPGDETPSMASLFTIDNKSESTTERAVVLRFYANGAEQIAVSNQSDFQGARYQDYVESLLWELSSGVGEKTVYVRFRDENGVYTDDTQMIRLVASPEQRPLPEKDIPLAATRICAQTQQAYKAPGNPAIYYVTAQCTKRAFTSAEVFYSYFNSWDDVENVSQSALDAVPLDDLRFMPKGPKYDPQYGALVKVVTDPRVYLLLGGEKYWITSATVFEALRYDWKWIEDIDARLLDKYKVGAVIERTDVHPNFTLIKYEESPKVYRLEPDNEGNTVKRHIANPESFTSLQYRWDRIVTISTEEVYPEGQPIIVN